MNTKHTTQQVPSYDYIGLDLARVLAELEAALDAAKGHEAARIRIALKAVVAGAESVDPNHPEGVLVNGSVLVRLDEGEVDEFLKERVVIRRWSDVLTDKEKRST